MKIVTRALVAALLLAPAALAADDKDDAKAIEGTWKIKSHETSVKNETPPAEVTEKMRLTFKEGKLTIKGGPQGEHETTYTIDTSKKPGHLNLKPAVAERKEIKAIFKIEKDMLTICGTNEGERPTEFAVKDGTKINLLVLERVKE